MIIFFSFLAILINLAMFSIAFLQLKIASAKTKLELYNKRFDIYVNALEYFQACWHKSYKEMQEKSFEITPAYRESRFLFAKEDGVYETLGEIQHNGTIILAFEKSKYESKNKLTNNHNNLELLHKNSLKARISFQQSLELLEEQMEKYIQFKDISGWGVFNK